MLIRILLLLLLSLPVEATTYYIRDTANATGTPSDANTGLSWAQAWKTVKNLNSTFAAGDTVFFGAGEYDASATSDSACIKIPAGTHSNGDWTAYIDSAWWSNQSLIGGKAILWGGPSMKGMTWTPHPSDPTHIWYTTGFKTHNGQVAGTVHHFDQSACILIVDDSMYNAVTGMIGSFVDHSQDTGWYRLNNTIAGFAPMGKFWHNWPSATGRGGVDTVYVRFYTGQSPTLSTRIRISGHSIFSAWGQQTADMAAILGFKIYAIAPAVVISEEDIKTDSILVRHCSIKWVANSRSNNTGVFQPSRIDAPCGTDWLCDTLYNRQNWKMSACSLLYAKWEDDNNDASSNPLYPWHGAIVTEYATSHMVVESCYFAHIGAPLFKGRVDDGWHQYNVSRYNKFYQCQGAPMVTMCRQGYDSAYGNLIIENVYGAEQLSENGSKGFFICNNTFVNSFGGIWGQWACSETYTDAFDHPNVIKYNVFYNIANAVYSFPCLTGDTSWTIDSNLYFNISGSPFAWTGGSGNLAAWQARTDWAGNRHDLRSTTNDPAFQAPLSGDYTRPGVAAEINQTYVGKVWTLKGYWQPLDGSAPAAPTVISVKLEPGLSLSGTVGVNKQ